MPSTTVHAPVNGKIEEIRVTEGQTVNAGDIVFVETTAKTESSITAPASGKVTLFVQKGTQVNQGDRIAEIVG